jgi:hypothetical protein
MHQYQPMLMCKTFQAVLCILCACKWWKCSGLLNISCCKLPLKLKIKGTSFSDIYVSSRLVHTLCLAQCLALHSVYTFFSCLHCRLASVLSTNHRRALRYLLCPDWSNRWLTVHAGYIPVQAGYILVHAGYILVHAGYIPVLAGYMSNCHLLITSLLNEGAVIKTGNGYLTLR